MKNLLGYLKNYKKETILAPLFKLLEASFELLVPLVMASVIDRGIGGNQTDYIVKMCLVLVLLGVVGLACSITAQYFAAKAAVGFAARLRHALFEHIQSLSFSGIDTIGTVTAKIRAAFGFTVKAIATEPNTTKGERSKSRRARFMPDCT